MWAAITGHYNVVKTLLEKGADPNVKSKNNLTALNPRSTVVVKKI